ncbi:MAG: TIGR00266 family protein [Turicibacter sp.]|nr:TIGR00266 family protein [Turicibacter sp.]
MNHKLTNDGSYPMIEITLSKGEEIMIERGSMVYHHGGISLEGKMNSNSGGFGGLVSALGRSMVSGESMFITKAKGMSDGARIAIAPDVPGTIKALEVSANQQWRINDSAFLACDTTVAYEMKRQSAGKALFAGTGGFFIMETRGSGTLLVNAFGDLLELEVDGKKPLVVDNTHVVAWSGGLSYNIQVASGSFGFKTGEGLVNEFNGRGKVLIQTRNVRGLASAISAHIPKG